MALFIEERLASVGLYSAFYVSICLKNLKDFAFLMAQSGIYGKSPNNTSTTFYKENGTVPAQPFLEKARHRAGEFVKGFSA